MRGCLTLWSVALGLLWSACATPSRDARAANAALPERWHYDVSIDAGLTQVEVKLCFEGASASELRPGKDEAASKLTYARWLSPGSVHRLPLVDGRIQLDPSVRDACVAYGVKLAESGGMDAVVRRVGRDVLASPSAWLWRPQRRAAHAQVSLKFLLPAGQHASIPWPAVNGVHRLTEEAFRFESYAAFGRFQPFTVKHRDATLEVAVLDGELAVDQAAISRWLAHTVEVASGVDGKFPSPRAQILLVPSGSYSDPVQFGMVARGGAGSIILFMSSTAEEMRLKRDWVLPHELSHLRVPRVPTHEAWLSEGLATYYQEVLLARGGAFSERETLVNMARALTSARDEGTGRMLAEESAAMHRTHAYRAVYWAGAAFFLLADVELRRRTQGEQSLDRALSVLRQHSDFNAKTWTAEELLRELDRIVGVAVFVPLAEQHLAQPFPDFVDTLQALGVQDGGAKYDEQAPLAAIRRAIFQARKPADSGT